jgi:hypothetical protein
MRGEQVVVRAFGDEALVRRVWDVSERAVFIVSDQNFRALSAGRPGLWPVGFFRRDVFRFDETVTALVASSSAENPLDWDQLEPWNEQEG